MASVSGSHQQQRHPRRGDTQPVRRDTIIDSMRAGVIVTDAHTRVVDINPAARRIIGARAAKALGQPIARVLADHPSLIARCYDGAEAKVVITVGEGARRRHFDAHVSPLHDPHGDRGGCLILLHDITRRVHVEEALRATERDARKQLHEQTLLREATTLISSTLDPTDVLQHIAEQMGRAVDATSAYICAFDPTTLTSAVRAEYYSPHASQEERVSDLGCSYKEDRQFLEKLQASRFDVDHVDDPDVMEDLRAHMQEYGARTIAYIPLHTSQGIVGFVELWESRRRRKFTQAEIDLCQTIVQNVAIALENARLYERMRHELVERTRAEEALRKAEAETRKQLAQQMVLREAATAIASSLNLTDVLSRIGEQMCQIVNGTSAYVLRWDAEARTGTVMAEYISPRANEKEREPHLGASTVVEDKRFLNALMTNQPWVDHVDDSELPASERQHLLAYGASTVLYMPLQIRHHVIGFAEIWETRQRREFTPDEIALCETVAQSAAIAFENARLYEQAQRELAERQRAEEALRNLNQELERRVEERTAAQTRTNAELAREIEDRSRAEVELLQRNRELISLQSATTAATFSLNLPFVLETVTWEMVNLLNVQDCTILEWDQANDTLSVIADYSSATWGEPGSATVIYDLAAHPGKKRVLAERYARQISIGQPNIETTELAHMQASDVKTLLMVPMVFQARVLGLVELKDTHGARSFTDHEISLAQFLANQTAVAIENARLYGDAQIRLREQTALREAGAAILSALDPQTVLSRIAEQMAQAIDVTSAYICSYDPESMRATVLAEYIGPLARPEEQVSDLGTSYLDDHDSGFLERMRSGRHDVSDINDPDLSDVERAHLQKYGARAVLYIPLLVKGRLIGFAELWESRQRQQFTREEISICNGIAQQAAIALENAQLYERAQDQIAERVRAEKQLVASLKEKEVLLQEIHHRVKNNLQVVSSLLNLQSNYVQDGSALEMFRESQNRILSMALIHEKLYRSRNLSRIDLGEYIKTLTSDLVRSYTSPSGPVHLTVDAADVFLSVDKAVPCGLIINELVSNALKHAFPEHVNTAADLRNGKESEIRIHLAANGGQNVSLVVGDNGVGLPRDLNLATADSLGLRLVYTLINQLDGTIEIRNKNGAEFELAFDTS
jgi:PAS domain S-box-containing protein